MTLRRSPEAKVQLSAFEHGPCVELRHTSKKELQLLVVRFSFVGLEPGDIDARHVATEELLTTEYHLSWHGVADESWVTVLLNPLRLPVLLLQR